MRGVWLQPCRKQRRIVSRREEAASRGERRRARSSLDCERSCLDKYGSVHECDVFARVGSRLHHVVSLTCTGACAPGIKRPAHAPRRRARTAIAMGTARASWRAGRAPTEGRTSSRHTGDTFDDHEQDARTTTTDGSHRTSTRIGHGGPSRCEDRPRTIRQRERIARRARALRRCSPKRIGDGWLRRRERPLRRAFPAGARGPTRAPRAPCTAEPFAKRIPPAPPSLTLTRLQLPRLRRVPPASLPCLIRRTLGRDPRYPRREPPSKPVPSPRIHVDSGCAQNAYQRCQLRIRIRMA